MKDISLCMNDKIHESYHPEDKPPMKARCEWYVHQNPLQKLWHWQAQLGKGTSDIIPVSANELTPGRCQFFVL